jgi:hypothetical protein
MQDPESYLLKPETDPSAEAHQTDSVKRSRLPDFQPLGNIRDYFTEQMKQDSIR